MRTLPSRRSQVVATAIGGIAALTLLAVAACSDTAATTTFTPQTGIVVRSESLTTGIGCGTGSTQIYKFVAVAVPGAGSTGEAAAAVGVFDCFADGVLVNLQQFVAPDGAASLDYAVFVYAFNETTYTAQLTPINNLVANPNTGGGTFASAAFTSLGATYSTTCSATEQGSIQVVAVCEKLTPKK